MLFAAVAACVMAPAMIFGPGATHSASYNYIWTDQFAAQMAAGNLYPRWLPGSFEGLGSPTFFFYPPLAYWVAGLFAMALSTQVAIAVAGFVALTLSGVAMHAWLAWRGTWPRIGAILYMVAPYHLMDFYIRGALAEFCAFVWLPLIALGIARLPERRGLVMLALSYAGLIVTHLPVAMLASVFLIGPIGIHAILKDRRTIVPLLTGGALGIGLSAFYLLGALTLQGEIAADLLSGDHFRPTDWSPFAPGSRLSDAAIIALAAGAIVLAARARSIWGVVTILAAVNALALIPFVWEIAPLDRAQFPWRLLGIVEFAGITALLAARLSALQLGLGLGLILFSWMSWTQRGTRALVRTVPYAEYRRTMPDAPEYLPAAFDRALIVEGPHPIDLAPWRAMPRREAIRVTRAGTVTLARAAFPIWRVTRDGAEVRYGGPFITFAATPGLYRIERRVLWQEVAGPAITAAALLLLIGTGMGRRRSGDRAPTAPA